MGAIRSPENRRPRSRPRRGVAPRRRKQSPAREYDGIRLRIASAFALLRSAGEAQITQGYAFKIAYAAMFLGPDEAASAVRALQSEREAALINFRQAMRGAERDHRRREVAALSKESPIRPGRRSRVSTSGVAKQFARAASRLCMRGKRRRYTVRLRGSPFKPVVVRPWLTPG
jgi:hypothetical protein